jgi:hypothetical protein
MSLIEVAGEVIEEVFAKWQVGVVIVVARERSAELRS